MSRQKIINKILQETNDELIGEPSVPLKNSFHKCSYPHISPDEFEYYKNLYNDLKYNEDMNPERKDLLMKEIYENLVGQIDDK